MLTWLVSGMTHHVERSDTRLGIGPFDVAFECYRSDSVLKIGRSPCIVPVTMDKAGSVAIMLNLEFEPAEVVDLRNELTLGSFFSERGSGVAECQFLELAGWCCGAFER